MKTGASYAVCIAVALCAAAVLSPRPGATGGAPPAGRTPPSASEVVLELGEGDGSLRRLAALGRKQKEHPDDATLAVEYAKLALMHHAVTGDARFLGFAEGALARWRNEAAPPAAIRLLRARVLQAGHRFRAAARELDRMVRRNEGSFEAMLLAADAWRRAGDIGKAKARCAGLAVAGRQDLARWCAAEVLLSLGESDKAFELASTPVFAADTADIATAQWALAVTADAAAAAGKARIAEASYRRALQLPGASIALHAAYADLLLEEDRPRDVLDVLAGLPDAEAVLLRRAMATQRLALPEFTDYRDRLARSFADAETLGAGARHLRERAMFELYVDGDARAALGFARRNWELQKGPEDAAILLRSARAAGQPEAAGTVLAWRRRFGASGG